MNPEAIAAAVLQGAERLIAKAVEPLQKRIAELEDQLRSLPTTEQVSAEVSRGLIGGNGIKSLIDLQLTEYMAENPPEKGDKGDPGQNGRDGLDLKDLFRAEGGRLVAVLSDGTTKDLGQFVGKDGDNGKDGLGFEDATVEIVDGSAVLKFSRGDVTKTAAIPLPTLCHIGFWGDGKSAKGGEMTTHDGSLWLALRDTTETPSYNAKDWQMAARKGADGQRGKDGKDFKPPAPVKLHD